MTLPVKFEVLVITLSDRASRGEYEDLSGPVVVGYVSETFREAGWECRIRSTVIADDAVALKETIRGAAAADLIITTGGTGVGPRDITVDTVRPLLDKEIPGIMEMIRVKYGMVNHGALLSRSVAGIMGKTLVFTLPGSVKAVHEYMTEISKVLKHTFNMLYGVDTH